MNLNNFIFEILIILFLSLEVLSQFITIPFKFNISRPFQQYNSTNFLNEFFEKEIILDLNIGKPSQKINSKINQNSDCFILTKDSSNPYFKYYIPYNSSSFKQQNILYYKPYKFASDTFYFPQLKKNYTLFFLLENYTTSINDSYITKIGLNIPLLQLGNVCPNFILDLKNGKIINKLIWSLKYKDKYDGEFIIGEELSEYNPNKYIESQYWTMYLNNKYIIDFDLAYIPEEQYTSKKNNNLIKQKFNITNAFLHINSGIIIGTSEYKEFIDKNFFGLLVNKSICQIDIVPYKTSNKNYDNDYYVYSCSSRLFLGETSLRFPSTNYYEKFPNLIFTSKQIEYNFELTKENLFELIIYRYYFKVIFKKNKNEGEKEIWDLGEPFYKKYTFTINLDAKTIGFYINKEKINNNNEKNNNNIKDSNNSKDKNKKVNNDTQNKIEEKNENDINNNKINYKLIKYLIEVVIVLFLILISYYIGVTVRERRKKRANELKDDNYEYIPEKNKNINNINNDSKDQKFIELNSKLGL